MKLKILNSTKLLNYILLRKKKGENPQPLAAKHMQLNKKKV